MDFRVFLPNEGSDGSETSVMRTDNLSEDAVWKMGDDVIAKNSPRKPKARADFLAPHVRAAHIASWRLDVQPKVPPPRHARLIGWPPEVETDARKNLAQQLRAESILRVR